MGRHSTLHLAPTSPAMLPSLNVGPILSSGYTVPSIRQIFTAALTAKFTFHLLPVALTASHRHPPQ